MYHVVVEQTHRHMSEPVQEDKEYTEIFHEDLRSDFVEFSVGNPRVEHITGLVHLYKRNSIPYGSSAAFGGPDASLSSHAAQTPDGHETSVSNTVCCLAIPADMSVAHFCSFIGAYLSEVRAIQVLRREGAQRSVCMVLLTFPDQDKADSFFSDFNGLPFSSLEPDILCRLVFVRSVEVISARGRQSLSTGQTAALPPSVSNISSSSPLGNSSGKPADKGDAACSSSSSSTAMAAIPSQAGRLAEATAAAEVPQEQSDGEAAPAVGGDGLPAAATSHKEQEAGHSRGAAMKQPDGSVAIDSKGARPKQSYASAAATGTPAAAVAPAPVATIAAGEVAVSAAAAPCLLWLQPPAGTTELPTCPVCLERLDEHISGIVTTVCNHRFHGECLKRWGDTSCPVCRYCMYSSNTNTSRCTTCGTNANLWICLICGHVGCGRYKQGHASDHWQESAHCYALELETQRVWDYAGDGYVHRLIQSKTDGKLVEVPSPAPHTCTHGSPGRHRRQHRHHRGSQVSSRLDRTQSGCSGAASSCSTAAAPADQASGTDEEDCPICTREQQQLKDALVSSKLDAITLEYNYLLATQLESQRQYFESMLAQQEARHQQQVATTKAAAEQQAAARAAAAAAAKENEKKRQQLERKLSELSSSVAKVGEEREFLRSLNETLLANQKDFTSKLKAAQSALTEKDAQLQDLQEQVRDLMIYIEAQRTIESAGGELQEATLMPVPQGQTPTRRRSRK